MISRLVLGLDFVPFLEPSYSVEFLPSHLPWNWLARFHERLHRNGIAWMNYLIYCDLFYHSFSNLVEKDRVRHLSRKTQQIFMEYWLAPLSLSSATPNEVRIDLHAILSSSAFTNEMAKVRTYNAFSESETERKWMDLFTSHMGGRFLQICLLEAKEPQGNHSSALADIETIRQ